MHAHKWISHWFGPLCSSVRSINWSSPSCCLHWNISPHQCHLLLGCFMLEEMCQSVPLPVPSTAALRTLLLLNALNYSHLMAVWQRESSHTWKQTGQKSWWFLAQFRLALLWTVSCGVILFTVTSSLFNGRRPRIFGCVHVFVALKSNILTSLSKRQMTAGLK